MAKSKTIYVCDSCGNDTLRWQGRCPSCGEWNSLKKIQNVSSGGSSSSSLSRKRPRSLSGVSSKSKSRRSIGIAEFDRVLGGGLVSGSLILLGGEPGIGKSTLLLQVASAIKQPVLYFSGEESNQQLKIRSERIVKQADKIDVLISQNINDLISAASSKYKLIIVDSIQTIFDPEVSGQPGGMAQVKLSAQKLQNLAKEKNIPVIITGHITKEGKVAGPKTLEHIVDTVLYLEGEQYHNQRIIQAVKNRYGSTGETGIFQMTNKGLTEVSNPSQLFLSQKQQSPGSVVTSIMEGRRPILVEIQALAEKTVFGYPKRRAQGINLNRVEVLTAVLSNRTKLNLADKDIYVNIVGGLKVDEPAIDLAVCSAIYSATKNTPADEKTICIGEVGLAGEIRPVDQLELRLREAAKQGYQTALVAQTKGRSFKSKRIKIIENSTLKDALENLNSQS